MTDERRKHSRVDSLNLLSYVCRDDQGRVVTQGMGRTLNVNESGILLETHTRVDPECPLSLAIGLKDDLVDVEGKVIHSRERRDGKFETGIAFVDLEPDTLLVLKQFIEAFSAAGG